MSESQSQFILTFDDVTMEDELLPVISGKTHDMLH